MEFRKYVQEKKLDIPEVLYDLVGKDKKIDLVMWDYFENEMQDSGLVPGDSVPDDYIDTMTDKEAKRLYNVLYKKFKRTVQEVENTL